jgi:hypothetical protein
MLPIKKIQFGGYTGRDYAQVRTKVSGCFDKEEDTHHINLKRKKHCKNKRNHYFVTLKVHEMLGIKWVDRQCDICGKRKFEVIKGR